MAAGERLVIKENSEKERTNRREILKETDGDEPEMSRGVAEPKEGNRGDDAGADE